MTKKIVLYCLAVMCCVLTVGCSGKKEDGQGSGKDLKIMFTVSDGSDTFRATLAEAAKNAAEEAGYTIDIQDAAGSSETQMNQIKNAKDADVIICALCDAGTAQQMEALAGDKPIVFINSCPEEEYLQKFSQEDLFNEFTRDEKGNVVLTEEEANKKIKKLGGYDRLYRIKLEADYLKELTMKGVVKRYGENPSPEIMERIIFELHIMKTMGFPGYFLIVQDFIRAARDMGVIVGPGRGSAAGSAVAYCLGITNIDPIKYDLLFERFLNPDRISLPDTDVDFDDAGRQQVLEWVTEKYGADKVSHIVTFGSMAAKMAIKDVARVLKLELSEANRLAKMVPEAPKMTLKKAYKENPDLEKEKQSLNPLISKTIQFAETLEGSIRQTGVHACGILISRDPLTDHIPIMPTEGESLMTTQYDGHFVEPIGLIKMDFLGLRTLSIIKTCLDNIKKSKHIVLNENEIPLDDEETFKLFTRGDTTGLFQFEPPGMKTVSYTHLRAHKTGRNLVCRLLLEKIDADFHEMWESLTTLLCLLYFLYEQRFALQRKYLTWFHILFDTS